MDGRRRRKDARPEREIHWGPPSSGSTDAFEMPPDIQRLLEVSAVHAAADNPLAALECLEQAETLLAARESAPIEARAEIGLAVADALRRRGQLDRALERVAELRDQLGPECSPLLRGRVLSRLTDLSAGLGRYDDALAAGAEAYELLRLTDEHREISLLELARGTAFVRRGDTTRARECFENALVSSRRVDHREGIALALNALGLLLKNGPNWSDARDFLTRALAVSETSGNYTRIATHSVNLGLLHTKLCDWEPAERHLARSIAINQEVGNAFALAKSLLAMALLERRRGRRELAEARCEEARLICEAQGYARERVLCDEIQGDLLSDAGRPDEARALLAQALEAARAVAPDGDMVPEIERRLASLALAAGEFEDACARAREAFRGGRRVGDNIETGAALRVLGEATSQQGRLRAAGRYLERALAILARSPERFEHARAQLAMARHLGRVWEQGSRPEGENLPERATDLMQRAWAFFASTDLADEAALALVDLAQLRLGLGRPDDALRDIARARAAATSLGRRDLLRRLGELQKLLEERSAESAQLTSPESGIVEEWATLFCDGEPGEARLETMLGFVVRRLGATAALVAVPRGETWGLEAATGIEAAVAPAVLEIVAPLLRGHGISLAADLADDPRFAAHAAGPFLGVRSLAALTLRLPEGEGILYIDRRHEGAIPFGSTDLRLLGVLAGLVSLGLVQIRRESELARTRGAANEAASGPFARYITAHGPIRQTFAQLARVGESTASILILGETGTGKGLLAQCVHEASSRRERPFVTVNCAALPEPLLESELFGHVQGSFTGAYRTKRGLFEEADGGTLFLDEISRTSLSVQAKLLHVLDSREVRAVGATRGRRVDVRVICASNVDLREAIRRGRFLVDLFYRLNDFNVQLPPLRDRREDVPLLVTHFFTEACREMDRHPRGLAPDVRSWLGAQEWPGNIRELMQVVRRLVALSEDGEWVTRELLPPDLVRGEDALEIPLPDLHRRARQGLHAEVSRLERRMIGEILGATAWNRSEAARRLGISYPNLLAKIKRYRLSPPVGKPQS
jgi:DNA-binding NtrC family response regulator/tetratricopeptide (TPR) repeat protein